MLDALALLLISTEQHEVAATSLIRQPLPWDSTDFVKAKLPPRHTHLSDLDLLLVMKSSLPTAGYTSYPSDFAQKELPRKIRDHKDPPALIYGVDGTEYSAVLNGFYHAHGAEGEEKGLDDVGPQDYHRVGKKRQQERHAPSTKVHQRAYVKIRIW